MEQFAAVDGRMLCRCGSPAAYAAGIGWYCERGFSCPVPSPIAPYKSDKERIAELEAELAELRKDKAALAELVRVIETDDVLGYVYDTEWADCCYCGEGAVTRAGIAHEADCFQWALEKARSAIGQ